MHPGTHVSGFLYASLHFDIYVMMRLMEKVVHVNKSELGKEKEPVVKEQLEVPHRQSILTPIEPMAKSKPDMRQKYLAAFIVIILLGFGTGYVAAKGAPGSLSSEKAKVAITPATEGATEAGVNDDSAFPDTAEGELKEGGIDGDGTHYLDRGMGKEKYVYLTSTVINLQSFVGKKVSVKGQTLSGKKAGWLMDVGKVKVIE